jgi:hypothetical protein
MLLWNQVALWRHAAGGRTITGYPFGPTNLPVNAFGPWPGGTSWTPPAETACVWPWLGRHSVIRSRGRGVGPPLHEATLPLRQQRTGVIARERTSSAHAGRLPGTPPCLRHYATIMLRPFQPARPMGARAWRPVSAWVPHRFPQCDQGRVLVRTQADVAPSWFVRDMVPVSSGQCGADAERRARAVELSSNAEPHHRRRHRSANAQQHKLVVVFTRS